MLTASKAAEVLTRYAECAPGVPPETWDPRLGAYRKLTPGEIAKGRKQLRREQLRRLHHLMSTGRLRLA